MKPTKPAPDGYARIAPIIYYDDPIAAIDWLCEAFGFETRIKFVSPDGTLQHSELVFGESFVMVGDAANADLQTSPKSNDGSVTQAVHIYVDDVDVHREMAKKAGAIIHLEPDDRRYGNRVYMAEDCEGHRWWFAEAQVQSYDGGRKKYENNA